MEFFTDLLPVLMFLITGDLPLLVHFKNSEIATPKINNATLLIMSQFHHNHIFSIQLAVFIPITLKSFEQANRNFSQSYRE